MKRLIPFAALLLSACAGSEVKRQKQEIEELREKAGALTVQVKGKSDEADAAKAAKADVDAKLADAEGRLAISEARIDSLAKSNQQLSAAASAGESELGVKLNAAVAEKDALAKKLADAQKERLTVERTKNIYRSARDKAAADLEKARTERDALAAEKKADADASEKRAEERAALAAKTRDEMGSVADAILKEMQAGEASAAQEGAHFTVTLADSLLFDGGSAKLTDGGAAFLEKLGRALKALGPREIEIEAHADDAPVKKGLLGGFEDAWALTAARAAAVARRLHEHAGLDPAHLNAEGYGEFRPRKPNDTAAGRAANRRVVLEVNRLDTP